MEHERQKNQWVENESICGMNLVPELSVWIPIIRVMEPTYMQIKLFKCFASLRTSYVAFHGLSTTPAFQLVLTHVRSNWVYVSSNSVPVSSNSVLVSSKLELTI